MDGVTHAGVGRDIVVFKIGRNAVFLKANVLQHGPKPNGLENFRLSLWAEINGLGIATALHVEHAVLGPSVLVVADELPVGVAAQRGLSRSRQPKEHRDIPLFAHVRRTVHGQDVVFHGKNVVHHREHALLDFPGVARSGSTMILRVKSMALTLPWRQP